LGAAAAYAAAHLPFLAPSLEDIDSINFALGLREFNPAEHQPHPPGYPVYIALGRAVLVGVRTIRPDLPQATAEALALSLCSIATGALAVLFAAVVFRLLARESVADLGETPQLTRWATVFLALCPLFWITGARPMSDMPGLAAAFAAQALMLGGKLEAAAFLAVVALGVRAQTFWLTIPLLSWLAIRRGITAWRIWVRTVAMGAVGALVWAIPLIVATGGFNAYLAALRSQAGEDFAFVDMLWANPTPRRLAFGLLQTLVLPWGMVPLAVVMLALAFVGAAVLALRYRRVLTTVLIAFAPYAVFHFVFQETITVRYALPVVVPIAFLGARALILAGRATNFLGAPIAVVAFLTAMPVLMAYGQEAHPAFRAIDAVAIRAEPHIPALLTSHFELRRPLKAADLPGVRVVWAPRQREWLELVNYWRQGGRDPVWFLANPKRTDLALIDPHSRTDVVRYRWAVDGRPELSGTRPAGVDWYRLPPPGWFLAEGWSLTAETGGVVQATGTGPGRRSIEAFVRCRPGPLHMVIGGRHLGEMQDSDARISVFHEDMGFASWTLTYQERNFVRFVDLPDGVRCAPGDYWRLLVRANVLPETSPPSPVAVPVAIRQFDIQPASVVIFGFGAGWHEDEYARETGLRWRWASDRSVLRVRPLTHDVRVRIRGESPLRYFDAPPLVTLSAGGRQFGRLQPSSDFELDVIVPADAVQAAGGDLLLETTRSFVPAVTEGSTDMRRLGLRIFDARVERAR
jgi:hypothetical protein